MATKQRSSKAKKKTAKKGKAPVAKVEKFVPVKPTNPEKEVLYARVSPAHYKRVHEAAAQAGISVSKYMDQLFDKLVEQGTL